MWRMLLGDRFAPITSRIGFLRAPLPESVEAMLEWNRTLHEDRQVRRLTGDLTETLPALEPLVMAVRPRQLLVATTGDWTAYFDCLADGTDPAAPVGYLCERLACEGLIVASQREAPPLRNAAVQFEMLGPEQTGWLNSVRSISATSDAGRWEFVAYGQVQPFEETDRYRAKHARDRFTSAMLADYCQALGVLAFDPEFYTPEAVLLHSPTPPGLDEETVEQAQQRLGIVPESVSP